MIIAFGCSTQPAWKGRPLSAWLGELNDLDQKKAAAAEIALKRIGTNAIPYLLLMLTAAETSTAEWLETGGRSEAERTGAVLAFRILGSAASQSLTSLGVLLTNQTAVTNVGVAYAIAQSMAGIGEQAIPQLIAALNHPSPNIRRASMVGLVDLGKKASEAMPVVMERLKDSDAEVRGYALFFVCEVSADHTMKSRVLRNALQDPDRSVRFFAAKSLKELKTN